MKIKNIKQKYQGKAYNLEKVEIMFPDNKTREYDRVHHLDSVTIFPIDKNGNIFFVQQFRVGSNCELIELPAGVLEEGEDPITCAKREIREEIGFSAEEWHYLGSFFLAPGYSSERNHVFLAKKLKADPLTNDEDEFIEVKSFTIDKLEDLVYEGKIIDGKSIAAFCLFNQFLQKSLQT